MTEKRTLTLNIEKIKNCEILKIADGKQITQREGAKRLCVTGWHFRRLLYRYRKKGQQESSLVIVLRKR